MQWNKQVSPRGGRGNRGVSGCVGVADISIDSTCWSGYLSSVSLKGFKKRRALKVDAFGPETAF